MAVDSTRKEMTTYVLFLVSKMETILTDPVFQATDKLILIQELVTEALLVEEVIGSGETLNQWIGKYLMGAKQEAKRIVSQALTVVDNLPVEKSPPVERPFTQKQPTNQQTNPQPSKPAERAAKTKPSPQARLRAVTQTYETQCQQLQQQVEQQTVSQTRHKRGVQP
ncbi:hypothetical protein I6N95_15065 [Vagococcus sp. BWB3-3]|uniref:Uncharacterized protein n=1 Tax=Vagococcus allomyrinae TaxID=2794353 RepID=A0A940PCB0_9ENTE|nr:hypothetical protein [Vagococcus allomyrinae]MBP1042339.1 hypothetical protein [Vagococcus allomyrinae]